MYIKVSVFTYFLQYHLFPLQKLFLLHYCHLQELVVVHYRLFVLQELVVLQLLCYYQGSGH